ncbi:MAG: hypothetical protein M3452_01360 [Chloroflexota bacterium]|nr:hypothetical protein [Chloroflexota bacterium]
MSKAERSALPQAPRLGGAARDAAVDFYFNSWRLVPANVVWGCLLFLLILTGAYQAVVSLLLSPTLAIPTAGIYRLAALIVRGDPVTLSDALDAYRRYLRPALALGVIATVGSTVLVINIATGFLTIGEPPGWALATAASWGLVILWAWLVTVWPLIVDPRREGTRLREDMRLAGALLIALPLRIAALSLLTALTMAVSTVLFAALMTIAMAYCALLGCRYVLPTADRLEGRATALLHD